MLRQEKRQQLETGTIKYVSSEKVCKGKRVNHLIDNPPFHYRERSLFEVPDVVRLEGRAPASQITVLPPPRHPLYGLLPKNLNFTVELTHGEQFDVSRIEIRLHMLLFCSIP